MFQTTMTTYLIWPLLGLLLVVVGVLIAKKNELLSNKRLIYYFLFSSLVLALPALLGLLDFSFMPVGYFALLLIYLLLGWGNIRLMSWVFRGEYKFMQSFVLTLFLQLVGMLFFVLLFNLCNELQYGLRASTAMLAFIFVLLFERTYQLYLAIPDPIYKKWQYSDSSGVDMYDNIDLGELKVVTLEIYKNEGDAKPLKLKGKLPENMAFGIWLAQLMEDYNKSYPASPIRYKQGEEEEDIWIFYCHNSIFLPKRYIDYELNSIENKIKDNSFIVAKRIKEYTVVNSKANN